MTKKQVNALEHGLYRIFWHERHGGGSSLAAVGSTPDGRRWMAPTNWIGIDSETTPAHWRTVERVELIMSNAPGHLRDRSAAEGT